MRAPHFLKWVSLLCAESNFISSSSNFYVNGSYHLVKKIRFYGTQSCANFIDGVKFGGTKACALRKEAESALVNYFHLTRNFNFVDAENMSKNAPEFLNSLLKRVTIDDDTILHDGTISRAVTSYLRYHPVCEFEPFFESIGLKYCEYVQFLPRDLMFLVDDELLLENYYVLCNYGVERNNIGKIFKEANEVFRYEHGGLEAKLRAFESSVGLKPSVAAKIVASSPRLLNGNVGEFVEFLERLKKVEIEHDWLFEHIREEDSYDWKSMIHLLFIFCKSEWSEKQVGELFKQHPHLLLECSGRISFGLIGILLKFGSTMSDVQTFLLQFPQIPFSKFTYNLHNSYKFLVELGMAAQDIGQIVRSYLVLLGSIELKKVSSLLALSWCGRMRLCQMVKDDPYTLEGWVLGRKVERMYYPKRGVVAMALKTQFLISLGFEERSKDMEKALKAIRGKGEDLQQRFDCLVRNGLSREEVIEMVKISPKILNQTSDVTEAKFWFFIDDLGYGVSDLLAHPKILSFSIKRLKLRLLTYGWLKDQGAVLPDLALTTLLGCSDEVFIRRYVNPHPRGPDFWKSLDKKQQ